MVARIESEMQAANIVAALLAILLLAGPSVASTAAAADGSGRAAIAGQSQGTAVPYVGAQAGGDRAPVLERAREVLDQARALLQAGYECAPVFVIILSALLLLPLVAFASFLVQWLARRKSQRIAMAVIARKVEGQWEEDAPRARTFPIRQHQAWLTVGEAGIESVPLTAQQTRIGRHQDNDIRLPDSSVHRHHAVIERTSEEEFVITDLSGKDGNGVRVNGERLDRAHLVDGDVIELGRTKLKFESVPI